MPEQYQTRCSPTDFARVSSVWIVDTQLNGEVDQRRPFPFAVMAKGASTLGLAPALTERDPQQEPSMEPKHLMSPDTFMHEFRLDLEELARLSSVGRATITTNPDDPTLQAFMRDCHRVVAMVQEISGRPRAYGITWLRDDPVQAFRGSTALELVSQGRVKTVITYLESIASGFVG